MKICHNCKHHEFERDPEKGDISGIVGVKPSEAKRFLRTIWYNQECHHPSSKCERTDPVTGELEVEWAHCRDVNRDGDCRLFERRETAAAVNYASLN